MQALPKAGQSLRCWPRASKFIRVCSQDLVWQTPARTTVTARRPTRHAAPSTPFRSLAGWLCVVLCTQHARSQAGQEGSEGRPRQASRGRKQENGTTATGTLIPHPHIATNKGKGQQPNSQNQSLDGTSVPRRLTWGWQEAAHQHQRCSIHCRPCNLHYSRLGDGLSLVCQWSLLARAGRTRVRAAGHGQRGQGGCAPLPPPSLACIQLFLLLTRVLAPWCLGSCFGVCQSKLCRARRRCKLSLIGTRPCPCSGSE